MEDQLSAILALVEKVDARLDRLEKKMGRMDKSMNPKDPNKPKKATTAFLFFRARVYYEVRDTLSANGNSKSGDIMKEIGQRWLSVKDTPEGEEYHDLAAKDKERYATEMAAYTSGTVTGTATTNGNCGAGGSDCCESGECADASASPAKTTKKKKRPKKHSTPIKVEE